MRERVVLDVLDAEGAVVRKREGRRAESPQEGEEEDAQLVLVLAAEEGLVDEDDGALEVGAVACDG